MATNQNPTSENQVFPEMPPIRVKPPSTSTASSPRVTVSTPTATATGAAVETPTAGAARKIAIAVDLSNESAFAVKWAVDHYIRPGDAVVLLHVRPTSVLYGADWGCVDFSASVDGNNNEESHQKLEDDFDAFTTSKASDLAQPLVQAQVPYKIHIVKDHDMKERLCLEVERLGFNAVIMGSRGFGASKRGSNGRLGSVSDYCVRHCVCPVVVVRYPDENEGNGGDDVMVSVAEVDEEGVAEEEEYHDASDERKAAA
ncbi:universal stress protein PHOS32-like [Amaranthus tricolor]|uniref:universal stress protein PHOS32-like n=1 Tax=Amaranthus tricolor TaxID=29722 RepID=UPI0025849CDD|nr:universal stress protein PHOS32-like [Amaranthus tricolor]XP_057528422.1 universal stress protein PHOS32-like [Amaranthus tricolor]